MGICQSSPFHKRFERWAELTSQRAQGVFHLRWYLRIKRADDDPILLQSFELLDKHLLGDVWYSALQFREAQRTARCEKMEDDGNFPFALKHTKSAGCGCGPRALLFGVLTMPILIH